MIGIPRTAAMIGVLICAGCLPNIGPRTDQPPIAVSTSVPLDGVAETIQIQNLSAKPLFNVRIVGIRPSDATTGSATPIASLAPSQIVVVNWTSFGAWTAAPGDTIEVYADSYPDPVTSMIITNEQAAELGFPRD
ncbi:hypothetical protein [Novipirellula caenicola]|uniref:LTD domain-containing protein n=1 Tax=Novipirellula caenicola TaxID=1536901 RepID=A0ABP9W129_9BACT